MKLSVFVREITESSENTVNSFIKALEDTSLLCSGVFDAKGTIPPGTEMILSLGGDGTLLSLLPLVGDSGIPVLGVNYGRLGFLSSVQPSCVLSALAEGDFEIEKRTLLRMSSSLLPMPDIYPYALNEITVHRVGAAMLGVSVLIDDTPLPAYWADGMLVSTSSGSTAYSLSVGGPIVFPGSKVLIVAPIAPHNLNVRPIIVPDSSKVSLRLISRDAKVAVSLDNRGFICDSDSSFEINLAPFEFNLVRLPGGEFIKALTGKLFWGYDIRNEVGGESE